MMFSSSVLNEGVAKKQVTTTALPPVPSVALRSIRVVVPDGSTSLVMKVPLIHRSTSGTATAAGGGSSSVAFNGKHSEEDSLYSSQYPAGAGCYALPSCTPDGAHPAKKASSSKKKEKKTDDTTTAKDDDDDEEEVVRLPSSLSLGGPSTVMSALRLLALAADASITPSEIPATLIFSGSLETIQSSVSLAARYLPSLHALMEDATRDHVLHLTEKLLAFTVVTTDRTTTPTTSQHHTSQQLHSQCLGSGTPPPFLSSGRPGSNSNNYHLSGFPQQPTTSLYPLQDIDDLLFYTPLQRVMAPMSLSVRIAFTQAAEKAAAALISAQPFDKQSASACYRLYQGLLSPNFSHAEIASLVNKCYRRASSSSSSTTTCGSQAGGGGKGLNHSQLRPLNITQQQQQRRGGSTPVDHLAIALLLVLFSLHDATYHASKVRQWVMPLYHRSYLLWPTAVMQLRFQLRQLPLRGSEVSAFASSSDVGDGISGVPSCSGDGGGGGGFVATLGKVVADCSCGISTTPHHTDAANGTAAESEGDEAPPEDEGAVSSPAAYYYVTCSSQYSNAFGGGGSPWTGDPSQAVPPPPPPPNSLSQPGGGVSPAPPLSFPTALSHPSTLTVLQQQQ